MHTHPSLVRCGLAHIPRALQRANHFLPVDALRHAAHADGPILSALGGGGVHWKGVVLHLVVHIPERGGAYGLWESPAGQGILKVMGNPLLDLG